MCYNRHLDLATNMNILIYNLNPLKVPVPIMYHNRHPDTDNKITLTLSPAD